MELMIATPAMAALVNCEVDMRRRWGDRWDLVARRLFQLLACPTPNAFADLTTASVIKKRGEHVFEFPDGLQIRARCSQAADGSWSAVLVDVEWEPLP